MVRKSMISGAIILLLSTFTYAQETFTVAGDIAFPKGADIYVSLLTEKEWAGLTILSPPPRTVVIKLTPEQEKAKRAAFMFVGISKGTYGIRAFQDVNQDGKLERCYAGFPKEPCGFYRRAGETDWANIHFAVDRDIEGIAIQLY